jgi:trimethylamine:corrinoid methyltransferase-like protein
MGLLARQYILCHALQGTVKQQLSLPDNQDEVVSLEICSQYLVVATAAGAVRVYDLSRGRYER